MLSLSARHGLNFLRKPEVYCVTRLTNPNKIARLPPAQTFAIRGGAHWDAPPRIGAVY